MLHILINLLLILFITVQEGLHPGRGIFLIGLYFLYMKLFWDNRKE